MTVEEVIRQRRSVRKYASTPVAREAIDRCVEAARLAPSACNSQPWTFVVVDDAGLRERLGEAAFSGAYSMNAFARQAPVLIVVITEKSGYAAKAGGQFRGVQFSLVDIGIACEHLCLQATAERLGTCWLGWFNERAVKKVLELPRSAKVDILLSLGYPADDRSPDKVRKPLAEIRRFNRG